MDDIIKFVPVLTVIITGGFSIYVMRVQLVANRKSTQDIERLKTDLSAKSQQKISFNKEMKEALLDFFMKYHAWLHAMLDEQFNIHSDPPMIDYNRILTELKQLYSQLNLADGKLLVYHANDNDLLELKRKLKTQTVQMYVHAIKELQRFRHQKEESLYIEKLPDTALNKLDRWEASMKREVEIFDYFSNIKVNLYSEIEKTELALIQMINRKIDTSSVSALN